MIQGTGSHVGKSTLVAALCRIFAQDGYRVAPFKAQNMALNSYITAEGCEIGRAQAVQAHAARTEPRVEMNPVLLKPTSDWGSQVILLGRVVGNMKAKEYHEFKRKVWRVIRTAYADLERAYDLIVIEGAGSPAEVNLKKQDVSNMRVARMADAPVILVGDIDRGGVFASLIGTLDLLSPSERMRVAGFVINKFRGDQSLLTEGLRFLKRRTRRPVLGVMHYLPDLGLEEEDGVVLNDRPLVEKPPDIHQTSHNTIKIAVVHLRRISNFTDFDPLAREPGVELFYVRQKGQLKKADVVILPGTKNTIEDFMDLKKRGIDREICEFYGEGGHVVGICGGCQMLGRTIRDPHGVESRHRQIRGLGLLDIETVLATSKITAQVQAELSDAWKVIRAGTTGPVNGYEIHMGRTRRLERTRPAFVIFKRNGRPIDHEDGAISPDGRVWGTYLHGLFENDSFRSRFLDCIRHLKGIRIRNELMPIHYGQKREQAFDRLAQAARKYLDLKRIYELL